MGEALGEQEAKAGRPFIGPAGFRLERMIQRAGYQRTDFQILNSISCRPPDNRFSESDSYYAAALDHCRRHWEPVVQSGTTQVIMPMGNVALEATLGMKGILSRRGYVEWSERYSAFVLPTVHPSYILRGNSNWEAAFIYDLRHAVDVAANGWTPVERVYTLDPNPITAQQWLDVYRQELLINPACDLTVDIETPDKSASEDETNINLGYQAGPIYRIGFAYVPTTGPTRCISVPWEVSYLPFIQQVLRLARVLVGCNRHFDFPRLRAHELDIPGEIVDVQEAWHTLHSDLPKKLEHMAPYLVPRQFAWKHLSSDQPAYYNAIDCGVQIEAWYRCRELLRESGMETLYERDVRGLNPILIHMHDVGMPINPETRIAASLKLMALKEANREALNAAASLARPSKIYKRFREGLEEITIEVEQAYCSECGRTKIGVKHPHFQCDDAPGEVPLGERRIHTVTTTAWAQPLDFKPSQVGMLRYVKFKGYRVITRWDRQLGRRTTPMDENAIRRYALQHTDDPLFPLVLDERELGKLLSTYIGRVTDTPEQPKTAQELWWEAWRAAQYSKDEEGNVVKARTVDLGYAGKGTATLEDDDIPF